MGPIKIILDDSFTSAVSIDGVYYQPSFAALVPTIFLCSNEKNRKETQIQMKNIMWRNNICKLETTLWKK